MLKKRVIPTLLILEGRLVKGKEFKDFRDTGNPRTTIRGFSAQHSDEIMLINLSKTEDAFSNFLEVVRDAAKECFMPLTVGGGIEEVQQAKQLIHAGADKVLVNTAIHKKTSLAEEIAGELGSQALVFGIDYIDTSEGAKVVIENGKKVIDSDPLECAIALTRNVGCEIMLTSIERDGSLQGYDLEYAEIFCKEVTVPVTISGGARNAQDIAKLFEKTEAAAASCGSLFFFADNNPQRIKAYLRNKKVPTRSLR